MNEKSSQTLRNQPGISKKEKRHNSEAGRSKRSCVCFLKIHWIIPVHTKVQELRLKV